ncbi:TVP38/TMEM64 family protein [Clostridium gasigenes]|uniref:TVP38/TMEM64 family membrane protein n=2 Tax=Clostridium gasigenes TaxID=94869 RepID=A0A7X0SGV6_9CLOT|nr:TVP38/TMEM64 family protein [Clostridium gasigenes]
MEKQINFMKKQKNKIVGLVIILILILAFRKYLTEYAHYFRNPEELKSLILSFGNYSFLAYIVIQIAQIIIFFIPGELVQIAGGYIFGSFKGYILSFVGILIGSAFSFILARILGKKFVEKIVFSEDKWIFRKIEEIKKHPGKFKKLVFILYLIPGIPKDILGYICGVTDISLKDFLIISMIGRTPGLFISCFFGGNIAKDNLVMLALIGMVCGAIFIFSVVKGKRFIANFGKK